MALAWDNDVDLDLEVAFANDPMDASPTWTDVSAYMRHSPGFGLRRGRTNADGEVSAGTCTIALDNTDRRFDPTNTGSPYSPNVLPMKPTRLRAVHNAITYDLFYGFVESWPQEWPLPVNDALTNLQLVDGFKLLAFHETAVSQSQEASHTRVGNYLDEASWPAALRDLGTGTYTVAAHTPNCEAVLKLCQETALAEDGLFLMAGDGSATLQTSTHRSGATVTATYGDDGAELRYDDLTLTYDDRNIFNEVSVVTTDGSSVTVSDSASITAYGKRTRKVFDLHAKDTTDATSIANSVLARYKDPKVRITRMVVKPQQDPTNLWPRVLGDEVSTKLTIKRRPPGGGTAISQDVFIEGISHRVSSRQWVTTYELSPYA